MEPLRILVADDHPIYRHGLSLVLDQHPDLQVVATVGTGAEAVSTAATLLPDVVVMDLHMPETDGVTATREIVTTSPNIAVLVLTMLDDDDSVFAALRAGARGYFLKGSGEPEIVAAIQAVANGTVVFGPVVARRVVEYFTGGPPTPAAPFPDLTPREREVLDLLAAGRSNGAIAHTLVISPKTVRNHVSNILTKLQVADRAQAIIRGRSAGLG